MFFLLLNKVGLPLHARTHTHKYTHTDTHTLTEKVGPKQPAQALHEPKSSPQRSLEKPLHLCGNLQ